MKKLIYFPKSKSCLSYRYLAGFSSLLLHFASQPPPRESLPCLPAPLPPYTQCPSHAATGSPDPPPPGALLRL